MFNVPLQRQLRKHRYTAKRPEKYELSCKYTKKIVPLQSYWESSEPNRLIQVKHIHYAYKIIPLHAMHQQFGNG